MNASQKSQGGTWQEVFAMSPYASATYEPQGFCPKGWVARINGEPLRTSSGGLKRFGTKVAAIKAAEKIIKEEIKCPNP